jgi:hypothetical protein
MEAVLMSEKDTALEPTFADVMAAIAEATDLSEPIRRHWRSSLAGIAKAFDQPPELIPARFGAVRARMAALHHVPMDWTAKTLANHKSNAKPASCGSPRRRGFSNMAWPCPRHGIGFAPN